VAWLARAAGYAPLVLAGEADALALAEVEQALAQRDLRTPVAHRLPVGVVAALLARCAGYVGCDSGVSHLAALCGVPTVAVFGPTDPARWAPLGEQARAMRAPNARLDQLDADAVWAALHALLRDG
jgi:ADP-heptose:LPS heptosyltransferase